jgi:hypothetical protein
MRWGNTAIAPALLSIFGAAWGIAHSEILVTVTAADSTLAGQMLTLNGKFVGVVGDTISLASDAGQLAVHLPQGFYANLSLRLTGTTLQASVPTGSDCINSTAWIIRGASAPTVTGTPPRVAVEIPHLPLVSSGACSSQPSSLSCTETAAQVEVKSVPEIHAAVWVAGKDAHTTTPGIVSYPYCVGMSPRMDFVFRKDGYGNCAVDMRADGRSASYAVQCTLPPLPK